ncbi:MAG: hypothetical protein PHO91_01010 [Patescibacteria group bacterium]|nr:hypothetical protein [Patescibacteria group bacterium]
MAKTRNNWKDDIVDVATLELDLQNPRLPKHVRDQNDITQVRNYLLDKEDILRIARNIANNGYHRSAVAIVCKENGRTIVLDGNRRLAACQLLLKPELAPNARDKKELEELNKITNKQELKNVKITIAPSRKEAEKEIWDIHVNQLLKPWQVLQKLRMYRNLIDSGEYDIDSASSEYGVTPTLFKKELEKLFFYEQILEQIRTDKDEEELLKSGFNKIDRLILSTNGKKLLDYSTNNKGDITFTNRNESDKKLKLLVPYITDPHKVPAQATQDWLVENVFAEIDPSFSVTKKSTEVEKKKAELPAPRKTAREKNKVQALFGQDLVLKKGDANNIYMDVLDLYDFYSKNTDKLSKNFPALIRMSLRLLIESATPKTKGIADYVNANYENAKKQLTQDQKTTLANNSIINAKGLIQLLQSGAHNYANSANFEQTVGMSIIIGAMLNITHAKK